MSKTMFRATTALTFLLLGSWSFPNLYAQADPYDVDCSEGGLTQLDMNICSGQAAQHQDDRLEALVTELTQSMDESRLTEFRSAQQLWSDFREKDCAWKVSYFEGGSMQPMLYSDCIARHTEQRIDNLKLMLCDGRGVTGPCAASERY